ncbi:MAG: hypothetical protein K0U34_04160 [Alphaproteobacteria bacterium]|nr:hypothetical protein [Alphaproteobacteria bacterium]
MTKPLSMTVKANLIGTAAILVTGVYIAYDLTTSLEIKPCSATYPTSVSLNIASDDGEVMSAVELQARSQSQDWGVLEKLSVERVNDAPSSAVFKIALPAGDLTSSTAKFGGVGFPWRPSKLATTNSVCFAYSVWMPEDFDFSAGGILPGVATTQTLAGSEDEDDEDRPLVRTLRAHPTWSDTGTVNFLAYDPTSNHGNNQLLLRSKQSLSAGRWHKIEQEILLNGPNQNGRVRLWFDGELAIDESHVTVRKDEKSQIGIVLYHVSRGTPFGSARVRSKVDSEVRVTPMEISWK